MLRSWFFCLFLTSEPGGSMLERAFMKSIYGGNIQSSQVSQLFLIWSGLPSHPIWWFVRAHPISNMLTVIHFDNQSDNVKQLFTGDYLFSPNSSVTIFHSTNWFNYFMKFQRKRIVGKNTINLIHQFQRFFIEANGSVIERWSTNLEQLALSGQP